MPNETPYADMSADSLRYMIESMEANLQAAKAAYNEKRYSSLRTLVETQKATAKAIREEMDKLGHKDEAKQPLTIAMLNNLTSSWFPIKY